MTSSEPQLVSSTRSRRRARAFQPELAAIVVTPLARSVAGRRLDIQATLSLATPAKPGARRAGRTRRGVRGASCYVARPTMVAPTWHIITGEYAPAHGGVAEYSRSVARALAAAGTNVHVWAPPTGGRLTGDPGVRLHELPDGYGPRGLGALARAMRREPTPRLVLVQYVPHAFGM